MADYVEFSHATPGDTLYFVVKRISDGYWWNTSGTPAFEAYAAGNIADYDTAMTEDGATGIYRGQFPAGIAAGHYTVIARNQAGGTPAVGDINLGHESFYWDGSTLIYQTGDSYAYLGTNLGAAGANATEAGGTGDHLTDVTGPLASIESIVSGLGLVGSAVNAVASSATVTTGTEGNTYASTHADDGTYWSVTVATATIEAYLEFDIGSDATPVSFSVSGRLHEGSAPSGGDTLPVYAYDWVAAGWELIDATGWTGINGSTSANDTVRSSTLLAKHVGTGANAGKVRIRWYSTSLEANTALYVDQAYVSYAVTGSRVGYALGAIWVNTNASNTDTVPYVDGTADNPVSTWAAALTLSTALGINRFKIAAASSITLAGDSSEYEMLGDGLWTLALGGYNIANSYIQKASVSGTGSGSNAIFEDCLINAGTNVGPAYFVRCGFNTTSGSPLVAGAAGEYTFVDCVSTVAGSGTPYFNFAGTGGATGVNFRRWSGGSNITGDSNVTATMEVVTGGGQTITTGGGNYELRGCCRAVTITLTGSETVQVAAVTGPISIGGAGASSTVNLYGVHGVLSNTASGSPTVNDFGVSLVNVNAEVDTALGTGSTLTALATSAELAKVPKSDGAVTWNATALAAIQTQATSALNAYDPPTNAEMEARTILAANYATATALADGTVQVGTVRDGAIGADAVADMFSKTAITEAYAADGAAGTVAQILYLIQQSLHEFAISERTRTVKKLDGSTTAATFTLDDETAPTSTTRAT